ncbi:hypothetical protein ATANTOWER_020296, partial [Ataeniobius toweri]|nr:hypothetical protein [Ataeniobius toweri]
NERECECLPGYVGNGVQCLEKVEPPVDRCLEENGGCDPVATCSDLHYHANTAGVFHLRSPEGRYKMNFTQADIACQAESATLATFKQLGDAQQLGMHLCVAGWIEGGRVGYPTRFPSTNCGDNHVGLVMYKDPVDQSSKYDAYCYRLKEVSCSCPQGYVGNGDFCNGVLTSVLATNGNFSIFYKLQAALKALAAQRNSACAATMGAWHCDPHATDMAVARFHTLPLPDNERTVIRCSVMASSAVVRSFQNLGEV